MEDFQSKYTGEQVEELLDQVANGEAGGGDGGASVYTWEWDGNEQGSVTDEVFTSIYNSDVLYLRYAGMDVPATVARADQTLIILAAIQGGDSLLTIAVTFTGHNYTAEMTNKEIGGGDPLWYEDSEGRAFCDRDIQVDGNIFTNGAVVTGSIGVPSSEGYATGDKGQVLKADGNGGIAWNDLSIPTKVSDLENDNVYYTDFTIQNLEELRYGILQELHTNRDELLEAITYNKIIKVREYEDLPSSIIANASDDGDGCIYITIVISITTISIDVYEDGSMTVLFRDIPTNISQLNDDRGLIDEQFAQENFIGRSESFIGMKVALIDQFMTPYGSLLYAFPDTANGDEDDVVLTRGTVKTINGETIYGSGNISTHKPLITKFTLEDLRFLADNPEEEIHYAYGKEDIKQALLQHDPIFVPQSQDESYVGYAVMSGYYEDLLYLQVISEAGEVFQIETDMADDTPIYGEQVSKIDVRNSDPSLYGTYPVLDSSVSTVSLSANTYTVITPVLSDKVEIRLEDFSRIDRTYEYVVQFTVSSDAEGVELIVPDNVIWADGVSPAMTPGKTYEISFLSIFGNDSITATFLEF